MCARKCVASGRHLAHARDVTAHVLLVTYSIAIPPIQAKTDVWWLPPRNQVSTGRQLARKVSLLPCDIGTRLLSCAIGRLIILVGATNALFV